MFSSALLWAAFLFLSVDGRSTTPWNRRLPSMAQRTTPVSSHNSHYALPQIRGGESADMVSNTAPLPTPVSKRIREESDESTYQIHPSVTGGHIPRAGKLDPKVEKPKSSASTDDTASDVVVKSVVIKEKKATNKKLKRHKQIAKKLKVRVN